MEAMLRREMRHDHLRHDALDLLKTAPAVDELLAGLSHPKPPGAPGLRPPADHVSHGHP
jgi:hypothetical protein